MNIQELQKSNGKKAQEKHSSEPLIQPLRSIFLFNYYFRTELIQKDRCHFPRPR